MNITELIAQFRRKSGDDAQVYRFSDDILLGLFNEAVDEAATRADLLFDATTEAVCSVAVTADTANYSAHQAITNITKATFVDEAEGIFALYITDREYMDDTFPSWREDEPGEPAYLIVTETDLQIHPPPALDGALNLEVYRVPLSTEQMVLPEEPPVEDAVISPVIAAQHHRHLVDWPLNQYFGDDEDADAFDERKAKRYDELFSNYFGPPKDFDRRRSERTNAPHRNKVW